MANYPDFLLYEVEEVNDDKTNWHQIGAAWKTKDGKGFTIKWNSHPMTNRTVMMPYEVKEKPVTKAA